MRCLRLLPFVFLALSASLFAQSSSEFTATSGNVEISCSGPYNTGLISFDFSDSQNKRPLVSTSSGTLLEYYNLCNATWAPGTQLDTNALFRGTGSDYEGVATGWCVDGSFAVILGELDIAGNFTLPSRPADAITNITVPVSLRGSLACCPYNPNNGSCASPIDATINVNGVGFETITLYPDGNGNYSINGASVSFPSPYKAFVASPINSDGSSIFKANRGVIPVKFAITNADRPTCDLPPATVAVTRTAGGVIGSVGTSTYGMAADSGPNFRIDPSRCQYIYNLAASALGVGTYRADISINGAVVGNAVFALK